MFTVKLFDVIVACENSVYLWLLIQSLVDVVILLIWRVHARSAQYLRIYVT